MNNHQEIIWLTENYPPQKGGMANSCDRIINCLRLTGMVIHIIHFTNRKEAYKTEWEEQGTYSAVPVTTDESHTLHLAINFLQQRNLNNCLLVVFGGYLPMLAAPIYKAWLSSKLVLMIRGNDFDSAIFSPKKRQILADAVHQAELVTCVSNQKAQGMSLIFPRTKICFVPNGITTDSWQPLPSDHDFAQKWQQEHSHGKLILGCFGHLKEKKGLDILLSAFDSPALKARYHLLLIGEITEHISQELQQLEISFHCLPFMERMDLIKFYLCCHGLIVPSHYDGMPNVLLEAGMLEIPVIASDKDGMHDLISHQEDGLLFKPGNAKDLRQVLFAFDKMTPIQRKQLGTNLSEKIIKEYNSKKETDKYLKIFQTL